MCNNKFAETTKTNAVATGNPFALIPVRISWLRQSYRVVSATHGFPIGVTLLSVLMQHTDKDWLYQKYIVEKLDCVQIGKLVNRDPKTIWYWLKKHNIPTRPRGTGYEKNLLHGRSRGWHHTKEAKRKVSEASIKRGAVPYLRNGVHFNKGKRGAVVWNWKGGITPERQTFYRSEEWKEAVKIIWKRDNAICQRCGLDFRTVDRKATRFHVHHIQSFAIKELRAEPSNLILLCHTCHNWVHSKKNVNREFLR